MSLVPGAVTLMLKALKTLLHFILNSFFLRCLNLSMHGYSVATSDVFTSDLMFWTKNLMSNVFAGNLMLSRLS